jgi:hypothetical protein
MWHETPWFWRAQHDKRNKIKQNKLPCLIDRYSLFYIPSYSSSFNKCMLSNCLILKIQCWKLNIIEYFKRFYMFLHKIMSFNVLTNNIIRLQASNVLQYLLPSPCPNQKEKKTTKVDGQCKAHLKKCLKCVFRAFGDFLVVFSMLLG